MPTGSGKSRIYQFAATMTPGLTVVVSPRVALLEPELAAYAERRAHDEARLDGVVKHCQAVRCRTRSILDDFGEEVEAGWRCHNCDACDLPDRYDVGRGREARRHA